MTDHLLKRALTANAGFSIASALTIFGFAPMVSSLFAGIATVYLYALAAGLIAFASYVAWVATRPIISIKEAKLIILADWGWVLGSAALIAFTFDMLSLLAIDVIAGVAAIVAGFAIAQTKGMNRLIENNKDVGFQAP